jgi:GNAT superfamily N-acetyltransferase
MEEHLASTGWTHALSLTHMVHRNRALRAPLDVAVGVCSTEDEIATFSRVQSAGFGAPEWFDWVHKVNRLNARSRSQRFYVARRDGRPAGVCLLFISPRTAIAGLYAVATLPEERGHGVAAALVARALDDAGAAGAAMTVLNTKSDGDALKVFARLGFESVFDSLFFTRE